MATNAFSVKPELSTPFPEEREFWRCPKTGILVPKDPEKNLHWRAKLLKEAEDDEELQQDLYTACSQSLLLWVNAFAFTFRINETDETGKRKKAIHSHLPFVTWDIQDKHLLEVEDAIDKGFDLLTDKTRDMGASWNHIAVIHHKWLFQPGFLALEMSRVETDVDGSDNPRCLFVKHDYINKWLPEWMLPSIDRTRMHIVNSDSGARIDGESSNKAAGSGDRRHVVLLDEFAKMENSEKIKAATADVGPRMVNSTPWGPGTTYSKWRMSGQIKVFSLPWYEHPEKGRGRYVVQDDSSSKWKIRSPWYDVEAEKRTPQEMAQEVDMDHIGSGDSFFEPYIVEEHKRMFGRPPFSSRTIDFAAGVASDAIPGILMRNSVGYLKVAGRGPLKLYTHLINGKFDQTKNYVLGIDISKGQGASNSVISIFCKETAEKVAEWADANTPPYDFARIACAIAMWVGGASNGGRPLMIWEANGPGWDFGREVVKKYQYPFYFMDQASGTIDEKKSKRYGWHSSTEKKETMLGNYRRALAHGGYINHSIEALDETLMYIRYPDGGIGPAALVEENTNARKTHGDRTIADGLSLWGCGDVPRAKLKMPLAPHKSIGGRMNNWKKQKKEVKACKRFDFRSSAN